MPESFTITPDQSRTQRKAVTLYRIQLQQIFLLN